ncbi:MAG: LemA family protein [Parachlamydiaceae bacterium]|nr:LemA family protein [Parachlamydiaceae bacterium]
MSTLATVLLGLVAFLAIIALWGVAIYNKLVALRNQVKNAWGQIDVQLQRRYDLIPNLVETVKGYMNFERSTLEAVIQARNQASNARESIIKAGGPVDTASMKELMVAEGTLKGAMTNLFALAENYPQLRATENMKQLQEELSSTENKISFSRQAYNDQVLAYNNAQQEIPAVFFASALGHHPADLFVIDEPEAKKAIKVSF